ncbi:cupin domain-containing protein [Sulfurimonas sp. C5]|uniref:cupin domain-containing protein n=1 Tax=Sulfurimonas sp. C5 TaxID=3036947 RepID=UPI002458EEFF|nr:cupin domain-containing protein [Sulfurimonas sp. C5]MDH4945082.1 cupin domain-containing protein [Sulfurimonas sp. C5]
MNSDYDKRALINTATIEWEKTEQKGIFKKTLSFNMEEETALVKMEEYSKVNENSQINNVEIFVLEGTYINEFGKFGKGSYLHLPKEDESFVNTTTGCTIFRKTNYSKNDQQIIIDTSASEWLPGQGNLEVLPLDIQTALVKWPKNERFIPHKHWGGEEIFVLQGTFMDEHGKYPEGSWIRSPHLSEHYPYVDEETIIFVKTGHL